MRDSARSLGRGWGDPRPRFYFPAALAWLLTALVWGLAAAAPARATAIEGVASLGGELQPGVTVWALPAPAFNPASPGGVSSPPTNAQGRFSFDVPPGRVWFVAFRKGMGKERGFEPGDYYCFYSGNPVSVGREPVHLGFNLIRVPDDGGTAPGPTGIEGTVLFEGKPLGRCYLYVYQDAADDFHGMGFHTAPVGPDGRFKVRLPSGTYYLVARQRQAGGMYGPLSKGDRVGAYYANPVVLKEGQTRRVVLEVIGRVDSLEEAGLGGRAQGGYTVRGKVRDAGGKPLAGLRVMVYGDPETSGKPRFVSEASSADGSYVLKVPLEGAWYLVARRNLGGPPEPGEYYGRWEGRDGKPAAVMLGPKSPALSLDLTAAPVPGSGDRR